ncbi:hypothetical protein BDB00DRAFT_936593 [Zychaea mexicana]|uniref:uncharacterized protein n=1 Tax=Zychaea mexicana TaxID=64656 RepID=UPI0022FF074A|nr:uncharacterized protein BDB00DRAFT_936593 [Zychaea mexicana]KAI9497059.1 hypothetical protein BDB00DRAFT_936593 [Zychaea mexicana]
MDTNAKIVKQVEFYFSDSNFPFDKFLFFLSKKNSEGWIPLETIVGFKKMQMITDDKDTVVSALRSANSDLVELNEAGDQIRRTKPLVEQNFVARSVYAKGFPLVDENNEKPVDALIELQDKIEDFFQEHGKVLAVRLRKTDARPSKFKGSVFVEFDSPQLAEEVAQKSLQYEGTDLLLKTKKAYLDEKFKKYRNMDKNSAEKKRVSRKFSAFVWEREQKFGNKKFRGDNNDNKKGNRKQHNNNDKKALYEGANHRLLKFRNAKDLDDTQLQDLVGKDKVEKITRKDDGSGFVLLSSGEARQMVRELFDKSVSAQFFSANGAESKEFAGEGTTEAVTGEKRKAEDDVKEEGQ